MKFCLLGHVLCECLSGHFPHHPPTIPSRIIVNPPMTYASGGRSGRTMWPPLPPHREESGSCRTTWRSQRSGCRGSCRFHGLRKRARFRHPRAYSVIPAPILSSPRRRGSTVSCNLTIKVPPLRIGFFNEINFPFPAPLLDSLFASNRLTWIIKDLVVHKPSDSVLLGETFDQAMSVLIYSPD